MSEGSEIVVGISDMSFTGDPTAVLVTYSLGSCIGVTLYDPQARVGGMLHAMMPLSKADPAKSATRPAMYADTGTTSLLQALFDRGATRRNLVAKVAGAAHNMDGGGLFRIGERNFMVVRKILWKNDILIAGEDIGGTAARTMALEMATGRTVIKANGKISEL